MWSIRVNTKKFLGNIGHIGTYSLDFGKIITTGEGGLLTTNNKKLDKICRISWHGHENNQNIGENTKKSQVSITEYRNSRHNWNIQLKN